MLIKNNSLYGILLILLIAFGTLGYKIWDLSTDLDTSNIKNKVLVEKLQGEHAKLVNKKSIITNLEKDNKELAKQMEELSDSIDNYKSRLWVARQEAKKWKNKPPTIKYKEIIKKINPDSIDYSKATCDEAKVLNEKLSEMTLKDFK